MLDPAAAASLASAVVAGLSLLLTELRHRKDDGVPSEGVRTALLQLEEYLADWADQAATTNMLASEWAAGLPDPQETALAALLDSMQGQSMSIADVESLFAKDTGLIPPSFARDLGGQPTLERLLRVYAPAFYDLLVVFSRRKEQLHAMAAELERRHAEGGREAVNDYLSELDRAKADLELARRELAEFIVSDFPLNPSR